MTTTVAERIKAKRARRPIYLTVRRLVDPATGESIGALVPLHPIDQRLLKERKFHVDREIRAELKQPREVWKHRLMHKIGMLLVDEVEGFEHMDSHEAIKHAQAESGVCCDSERFVIDLGQFGRHEVDRKIPRSIAFDEMPEDEFERLFLGVTAWVGERYAHVMLDDVRKEFWQMANREPVQ
jgi:hypothetical protein